MFVKICGLSSPEAIDAAVAAGADALGFVFAASPRQVTPERAATLCAGLPRGIVRVAVMRHPTLEGWQRVAEVFAPDWLQSDAEDFAGLELPAGCVPLPVYRNGATMLGTTSTPRLLFEGPASGSGRIADWQRACTLARRCELILAGGLNAENVARAVEHVQPWGVDVSSGVERRPGDKDPTKIAAFVARVRAVEPITS
jgi:phosphoribosylanthranilate isomerase